jgi:hypothetical protein
MSVTNVAITRRLLGQAYSCQRLTLRQIVTAVRWNASMGSRMASTNVGSPMTSYQRSIAVTTFDSERKQMPNQALNVTFDVTSAVMNLPGLWAVGLARPLRTDHLELRLLLVAQRSVEAVEP